MASGSIWTTSEKFDFLGYCLRNRKRTLGIYQAKRQTRILSKCHCKRWGFFMLDNHFEDESPNRVNLQVIWELDTVDGSLHDRVAIDM